MVTLGSTSPNIRRCPTSVPSTEYACSFFDPVQCRRHRARQQPATRQHILYMQHHHAHPSVTILAHDSPAPSPPPLPTPSCTRLRIFSSTTLSSSLHHPALPRPGSSAAGNKTAAQQRPAGCCCYCGRTDGRVMLRPHRQRVEGQP